MGFELNGYHRDEDKEGLAKQFNSNVSLRGVLA
jgi:hypothetical protein